MTGDHDTSRREKLASKTSQQDAQQLEVQRRYQRWLKRARTEDLAEVAALRFIYPAGKDQLGRRIVVFIGRNFPARTIDLNKVGLARAVSLTKMYRETHEHMPGARPWHTVSMSWTPSSTTSILSPISTA